MAHSPAFRSAPLPSPAHRPALGARPRLARPWLHRVALVLAFAGVMTTGIVFSIGPFNFSFERLFGLVLLGALGWALTRPASPGLRRLLWLWTAWLGVLFVAALASGDFVAHLPALVIAAVPIGYFATVTSARVDGALVDRIVRVLLWMSGIGGVLTLLAGPGLVGVGSALPLVDLAGRLKLTTLEPNLLGSALGFLLLLGLPRARWNASTIVMYALAGIAFIGALSKGPLIAVVVGGSLFGLLRAVARRENLSRALVLPVWLAMLGTGLLLVVLPSVTDVYDKLLARQDAIMSRSYLFRLALDNFWTSPVIGRGPGDFGLQNAALLKAVGGQDDANNLWIGQMMINIMHDSGIAGLVLYVLFLLLLLHRGMKWVRAGSIDHCGYLAAFVSVLVASQASTVHLNAIFGLAAGLVAALPDVRRALPRA